MTIHELTRISRNKLVVVNISFSGGTATPTSTLRLETFNRDMSPNSRVTNLGRFHNSNLESYWKFEMKSVMNNESLWAIIYGHSLSNNDVDVRRCIKIEHVLVSNIRHQQRCTHHGFELSRLTIYWKRKKVRQVTQTSIVSIGENFCDRLGNVIFLFIKMRTHTKLGNSKLVPIAWYITRKEV